jgi:hypothetical protein
MRYLHQEGLKVPRRVINGPGPHGITWALPTSANVRDILQNPAYAGAYVYGRRKVDRARPRLESPQGRIVRLPIDRWEVCIQDASPAYITWEEFVSNQKRLAANQNNYRQNRRGAAREGRALLQGIVLCGLCGSHMTLHYEGGRGDHLVYICDAEVRDYGSRRCQQVRGLALDAEIERLVLQAFEPDRVALALGALEQLEREAAMLERQWKMRIERARYEAARAQRQFEMCEPENRLVARNLERLWETKLRAVEEAEQEFESWRRRHGTVLTDEDRQQILALGEDLPKLWAAPTTTNADRKQIIRLIIKDVVLDQKRERGKLWFKINWRTGATTEHWIKRRTTSYREQADLEQLQTRVRTLNAEGKPIMRSLRCLRPRVTEQPREDRSTVCRYTICESAGESVPTGSVKTGAIHRDGKMGHTRFKGRRRLSVLRRALYIGGCEEGCSTRDNQPMEGPGKSG